MSTNYQPGIPTGTVPLNQDYKNIQKNFKQLNDTYLIDHVAYDVLLNNGYHKQIHLVPQAAPGATAGFGQLYSNTVNDGIANDQILYWITGGGINQQLTRNLTPVAAANGYTFIPGGLILQWGVVNGTHGGTFADGDNFNVTFATANINFPNNLFNIWTQPSYTFPGTGSPDSQHFGQFFINNNPASTNKTQFRWLFRGTTGSVSQFYWWAIGN